MSNQTESPPDEDVAARLDLALRAARDAGTLTLKHFQQADLLVEQKSDQSPVTVADRDAEKLLRTQIAAEFPDDGIIGEEFGEQPGTSDYDWVFDPIDGTKSFISGVPLYGNLVGILFKKESVAGVINIPGLDECVYARVGGGAWYVKGDSEPTPAHVSTCQELSEAIFVTTQVDSFSKRDADSAYRKIEESARITRTWGDCYGYLLVATGRADVMIDPEMHIWDAAAVKPVLEEAGGVFTDWRGQATVHSGEGVGTNRRLLPQVLRALAPHCG